MTPRLLHSNQQNCKCKRLESKYKNGKNNGHLIFCAEDNTFFFLTSIWYAVKVITITPY